MSKIDVRKGMPALRLDRAAFEERFLSRFKDTVFSPLRTELDDIAAAAWETYRRAARRRRPGRQDPALDPDYEIARDWLQARDAMAAAQAAHDDPASPSRILLINGWRSSCSSAGGFGIDVLDLGRCTSEFGRNIYPCKSCASTAMPLKRKCSTFRAGPIRTICRGGCSLQLCTATPPEPRRCSASSWIGPPICT